MATRLLTSSSLLLDAKFQRRRSNNMSSVSFINALTGNVSIVTSGARSWEKVSLKRLCVHAQRYPTQVHPPLTVGLCASARSQREFQIIQLITPDSESACWALASSPIDARISALCSPISGAQLRTRVGVRENLTAGPMMGAVTPSFSSVC